jgi:hypothetical protein
MTSHVRIGAETTPLLRKNAVLGRKIRIRCGGQPGYAAAQTLTNVPEAAAWRSRRGGRHGDICLTRRARPDWPHPPPCRIQSLPDELLAEWITALGAVQFSRAKRPFSGAIAVGMARLGGFDPEIPVQNGTRQPVWRGSPGILQFDSAHANGRLQGLPASTGRCGQAIGIRGRAGALARHAQPRAHPAGTGRLRGPDCHPRKISTTLLTAP